MARKNKKSPVKTSSEGGKEIALSQAVRTEANSRFVSAVTLSAFIVLFSVLALTSSLKKSPTMDEPSHLFAGLSYLKWADFLVNPEHPPLAKILAALPLLTFGIKDPGSSAAYRDLTPENEPGDPALSLAQKILFVENDADTLFFYAKLPMIALAVFMGIFVYRWSEELFGLEGAIASIFLYALDPNILAHSPIVHTDVPFTTFFFVGTYFFWLTLSRLTWKNLLLTTLLFGLAAVTKHSFPVIFVIWGVLGIFSIFFSGPQQCHMGTPRAVSSRWERSAILIGVLVCTLAIAYFLIWAAYGFRFHAVPGVDRPIELGQVMPDIPSVRAWVRLLDEHHIFPEAWIFGQLVVHKFLSRATYLLGEISDHGSWLYFPVAFAVKTPLPTLLILIGVIGTAFFKRRDYLPRFFLLIPVILYFSLAVWSRLNIGIRHLLPIYPFLFVLIGGTVAELWREKSWAKRGALSFLGVWYLISSFSVYPHYLAFFNELVGGPKNGHKILLDSNLDWGQDLKGLKHWLDDHGVKKIHFLYFGKADPQYYGIDAFYLPGSWVIRDSPNNDVPRYLAISANLIYGAKLYLTEQQQRILKSFELKSPIANIGYSILIYEVNPVHAQIYLTMGVTLAMRGQLDRAIELFREALRIQPGMAEAHENLARALAQQGKRDEAIHHFQEALRIVKSQSKAEVPR
jgi:hypothetical protein